MVQVDEIFPLGNQDPFILNIQYHSCCVSHIMGFIKQVIRFLNIVNTANISRTSRHQHINGTILLIIFANKISLKKLLYFDKAMLTKP